MVNQSTLSYREYQPGDEICILALFHEVFHREMPLSFWRWRYQENPWGRGIMRVAVDGDKMVGHFGVIPMRVQFRGLVYPAIFPMTAMAHPDYAGRGIFSRLMTETYESGRKQGFPLVYGFFNKNSYPANVRFGYHDIIKLNPLVKKLAPNDNGYRNGNIRAIDFFDSAFDRLWNRIKDEYPAVAPRTSELLNWRFVQDPVTDYARFAYRDDQGGILGYIVLKIYRVGDTIRGHIVDIIAIPDDSVATALLKKAYSYFQANGVTDLSCWMKDGTLYSRILEKECFNRQPGETNFAVMVLDKSRTELLPAENAREWFLTMGDSDVY
jgi:GNAT superfamily N-acetyltransferase